MGNRDKDLLPNVCRKAKALMGFQKLVIAVALLTLPGCDGNGDGSNSVACATCPDIDISLMWNESAAGVSSYRVLYGDSPGTVSEVIADVPINFYSFNAAKLALQGGDTACFSVQAYANGTVSVPSDPVCGVI